MNLRFFGHMKIGVYRKFKSADEIIEGFVALGHEVQVFDSIRSMEENGRFDLLLDINFHLRIAKFCKSRSIPMLVWSFDSGTYIAMRDYEPRDEDFFFLFNKEDVTLIRENLTPNCWYLPFSAGDELIKKPKLMTESTVAVLNSYRATFNDSEKAFQKQLESSDEHTQSLLVLIKKIMDLAAELHLNMFCSNHLEEILHSLIKQCGVDPFSTFPAMRKNMVHSYGQVISSQQREKLVHEIARVTPIQLYGDQFWGEPSFAQSNIEYMGMADYNNLPNIYNNASINISMTQIQGLDSIPQRVFHVLAAGGFLLTNNQEIISEYFKPGIHLDTFDDYFDLQNKVEFYLSNPEKRFEISQQGHLAFLEQHTMKHRIETILSIVKERLSCPVP